MNIHKYQETPIQWLSEVLETLMLRDPKDMVWFQGKVLSTSLPSSYMTF